MNEMLLVERLILKYWNSWQKPDWSEMRSCLANNIIFGENPLTQMTLYRCVRMAIHGKMWCFYLQFLQMTVELCFMKDLIQVSKK